MRDRLLPCEDSGYAQPRMTSSSRRGSTPVRSMSPLTTCAPRSSGRTSASLPLRAKWKGERA
ncbi:conserved hypothetical protein [Ricinus communis]|uniref:Uncharacterized protein n=1 Tax=Ricinus communis TaxID=3988 RepID=B9TIJ5_RICCO|nr:conserved hypothetical protein [Ricinus communis]